MRLLTEIDHPALAVDGTHLGVAIGGRPGSALINIVRAIGGFATKAIARWQRYRRARSVREALAGLDDRMLRDLGFCRDEIASVAAEYAGDAERTRMHVLQSPAGL